MLLDPLVNVIETLKERIQVHGPALRESETRTRMALIDPLLSALGWDISDPAVVTPEYAAGGGRADYALLSPDGRPAALIEAKRLGETLEPHRMQMLNYSNAAGVGYAGLTNGNQWEMYDVFKQAPLDERCILRLGITEGISHQCALKLLLLWRPNLASGQPIPENEPALVSTLVDSPPLHPLTHVPVSVIEPVPSTPEEPDWTPISKVNPTLGDRRPSAIKFNRGPISAVNGWNRALLETAEWLCRQGKLTGQECPIEIGKTRNLVSISPKHRNGADFKNSHQTSTGLYVELHFNSKDCARYMRFLLEKMRVSIDPVELRFD